MDPTDERLDRSLAWLLLGVVLVIGAAWRIWFCCTDDGLYWPDEIYQTLEPAHRAAFGYGVYPWEFIRGTRHWALPGCLAIYLKCAQLLGIQSSRTYVLILRLGLAAANLGCAVAAYRLARNSAVARLAAACAAASFALWVPAVYFAPRALSENVATLPVALGLAWALDPRAGRWRLICAASLVGCTPLIRLQCVIFCALLPVVLACRRAWRSAALVFSVLCVWAVIYGLMDRLTWGSWYHSALENVRFNVVEGKASLWGTSPPLYYLETLSTSMGRAATGVATLLSLIGAWRAPGLFVVAAGFLAVHMAIPHKELRFILPSLPLFAALSGIGLDQLFAWGAPRRALTAGMMLILLATMPSFRYLTFAQLGRDEPIGPYARNFGGPANRLLMKAGQFDDLCGIKVETQCVVWTGGSTYLHRRAPIYDCYWNAPIESRKFNYLITLRTARPLETLVATDSNVNLIRISGGPCVPDPSYPWKLP